MKYRGLFIGMRLFIRPWVSRFRHPRLIQAIVYTLDFLLGFLAVIGFSKLKISDHLKADSLIESKLGARPVILYLHGGAFACHLPNAYRSLSRKLSKVCNADIVMPDYRLAPQHKFPAGLDDCLASYKFLLGQGISPDSIAICGDSAGGNFTFTTMVEIARSGLPMPACAVTISPVVDVSGTADSISRNTVTEFYFSEKTINAVKNCYLTGSESIDDPRISPIKADLSIFPPVLIQASYGEILEDDAKNMQKAISADGGDATVKLWPDVPHVFHMLNGLPEAKEAIGDIGDFIKPHLRP